MTLALYGKSRKRQSGLIFAAFMAIIVASVGALAMVTSAFAHHLEYDVDLPTCQNDEAWAVDVWEGQWGEYREAVLTITDATTPVALRFSPYISSSEGSGVILTASGTGTVHTAGSVNQYDGDFTDGEPLAADMANTASNTVITRLNGTAWDADFVNGQVLRVGSELLKIVSRSADGLSLTVERGFGDSVPAGHSAGGAGDDVFRWVRGTLAEDTISWDLDYDAQDCDATRIIVKKTVSGTNPPATNFPVAIDDLGNGAGADYNGSIAAGTDYTQVLTGIAGNEPAGDNDDFTVTEASGGAGWTTRWAIISSTAQCVNDLNGGSPGDGFSSGSTASGGALNNIDPGQTVVVCFKNTYTPPAKIIIKKVVSGPGSSASDSFTAAVNNDDSSSGEASGLTFSQTTPYVHTWNEDNSTDDFDVTETDANQNGYEVVGTYVSAGDATCPAVPASGTTGWFTTTPENAGGLDNIENGDTYTVCFWNRKVATPSVSVTKDAPAATYNLGDSFAWTITATVTNGPTTSAYPIWDDIPAQFTLVSVVEADASLTCNNADPVSCTLATGAANGAHVITVNVTVANGATCGPVTNNVRNGTNGEAPVVATDTIDVEGCGSVSIAKGAASHENGQGIRWTISLTNTSAINQTVAIYDAGTTLIGSTGCVGGASQLYDDVYSCVVPPSDATITVEKPYSRGSVCQPYDVPNEAKLFGAVPTFGGPYSDGSFVQTATGGTYHEDAQADKSCLTVTKDKSATSNPPTWTINVQNTADVGQSLWVVDAGATFQGASGGSCTATAGVTDMTAGIPCTVNANATLIITVTKPMPAATCQGTDVDNAVSIWVGTFTGTPTGTPADFTDNTGNLFDNLNADPALCSSVIEICKVWAFDAPGELSDGSTSFVFDVSDTSETEAVSISGVTEGETDPTCVLVSVQNGLVTIDEQVPGGFNTPTYTSDIPGVGNGTGAGVEFFVDGKSCFADFPSVFQDVSALVREVLAVVAPATGEPLCTITFTNTDNQDRLPTGDLRVEKYLDITGDGDANDPGEGLIPGWDVNISGPDENGIFDLADGTNTWLGLTTNDVYILTEVQQAGFTVTNVTVDGVSKGASLFASAVIPNGGTTVVRFYNQPAGGIIIAHKVAVTSHNFGPDQDAPNDDDGWIITVTSAQCGINISLPTDANGNATFTNLPLCTDYVVSENPVNAASPGFNPVSPTSVGGQTPEGQTITFRNRKVTNDPPCVNCGPTPTPTVPTPTPTTPTTPTSTPVPPTATPTTPGATSTVAGERTPGPAASATPIAPSTGGGLMGGTSGGMNLVLIIAGLLALTSGLSFVALGRKHRS